MMADNLDPVFTRINQVDEKLSTKINTLTASVGTLSTAIISEIAACHICRPKVLGNGKGAIDLRVTMLEESKRRRSKLDWLLIGGLITATAMLLHWLPPLLGWVE